MPVGGRYFSALMLSFDIRSLLVNPGKVDGSLAPDDEVWMDGDVRPDAPLQVTGRVSVAGQDRFYFNGRFDGHVTVDCKRCLTPVAVAVGDHVAAIFSDAGGEDTDDPDVFALTDGGATLDVRPVIREQWLLQVPSFALCRPDCRGICPTCGIDRNVGTCSCAPVSDSRWDALRAARSRAD